MHKTDLRLWLARGFRLSLVVGFIAAAWQSWAVLSNFRVEQQSWARLQILYECAARLNDEVLKGQTNEFGNINVKNLCAFDGEDHWVSWPEIADVRNGVMKFETASKPFSIEITASAGLFGFLATLFATFTLLGTIRLLQWIWGRAAT